MSDDVVREVCPHCHFRVVAVIADRKCPKCKKNMDVVRQKVGTEELARVRA